MLPFLLLLPFVFAATYMCLCAVQYYVLRARNTAVCVYRSNSVSLTTILRVDIKVRLGGTPWHADIILTGVNDACLIRMPPSSTYLQKKPFDKKVGVTRLT